MSLCTIISSRWPTDYNINDYGKIFTTLKSQSFARILTYSDIVKSTHSGYNLNNMSQDNNSVVPYNDLYIYTFMYLPCIHVCKCSLLKKNYHRHTYLCITI